MDFNYKARQLLVLFPAYYCGHMVRHCFMQHDSVADATYKLKPNKAEQYKKDLLLESPDRLTINPTEGVPNAHLDRLKLNPTTLDQAGYAEFYTHAWHREKNGWCEHEEEHLNQDEQTQSIFDNLCVITIIPDAPVHSSRTKIVNQPRYTDILHLFYPGNEIWYVKKFDIPMAYIKYSDIINPDRTVFLDAIMAIADKFNWPMASKESIREFVDIYHENVLNLHENIVYDDIEDNLGPYNGPDIKI